MVSLRWVHGLVVGGTLALAWLGALLGGPVWAFIAVVAGLAAGLLITDGYPAYRWLMTLLRATRLLIEQEQDPGRWVSPVLRDLDLYPTRAQESASVPYVLVALGWDNRLVRPAAIEGIVATLTLAGYWMGGPRPLGGAATVIEPLTSDAGARSVRFDLPADAFAAVDRIRSAGSGRMGAVLSVVARVNGHQVEFPPVSATAYYVR